MGNRRRSAADIRAGKLFFGLFTLKKGPNLPHIVDISSTRCGLKIARPMLRFALLWAAIVFACPSSEVKDFE
jgi:hypothetical protein